MKKVVDSLDKYIKEVNSIQEKWSEGEEFIFPWFRGLTDCKHNLLPGLYRDEDLMDNEYNYRHDFELKTYPFLVDTYGGPPSSDWEWYFLMQHYGLPTRLLDWTEGAI